MVPANKSIIKKPAISAHPHLWLSPNFFRVNLISESVDNTDSVLQLITLPLKLGLFRQFFTFISVILGAVIVAADDGVVITVVYDDEVDDFWNERDKISIIMPSSITKDRSVWICIHPTLKHLVESA